VPFAPFDLTLMRGRFEYCCRIHDRKCLIEVYRADGKQVAYGNLALRDAMYHSNGNVVDKGAITEEGHVVGVEEVSLNPATRERA
jgi:hypothetical protein